MSVLLFLLFAVFVVVIAYILLTKDYYKMICLNCMFAMIIIIILIMIFKYADRYILEWTSRLLPVFGAEVVVGALAQGTLAAKSHTFIRGLK